MKQTGTPVKMMAQPIPENKVQTYLLGDTEPPKRENCSVRTCLHRGCNHRDKSDEDGAEDVDDREDEIDLKKCICVNKTNQSILANQNLP